MFLGQSSVSKSLFIFQHLENNLNCQLSVAKSETHKTLDEFNILLSTYMMIDKIIVIRDVGSNYCKMVPCLFFNQSKYLLMSNCINYTCLIYSRYLIARTSYTILSAVTSDH